jgi:hypothetical protein
MAQKRAFEFPAFCYLQVIYGIGYQNEIYVLDLGASFLTGKQEIA